MTEQSEDIEMQERMAKWMKKFEDMTPEEKLERAESTAAAEKSRHQMQVKALLSNTSIPQRQRKTQINRAGQWGETFDKIGKELGTGFLTALLGTRGNGKTQIAVELIKLNAEKLRTSRFCCATEFFMDIKATYKREGATEKDVIREYQKPTLLVIDEIGQRSDSDWENRLLFYLVNERYEDMKDTLFIGNLEPAQLVAAIGPSIASRMNETGGVIACTWESFR